MEPAARFVGRVRRHHKQDSIQTRLLQRGFRNAEMRFVDRVKGATEDADALLFTHESGPLPG